MANEWYCEIEGKQHGPMSPHDLKGLADGGKLQASNLIWKEGMQKKVPARTVRGLFEDAAGGTATATKPPPADRPPAAAKTQIADQMPAAKTQIADVPTTADAAADKQTWVEKATASKPPPKKDDEVVETQVAEDIVETQMAEDVVTTQPVEAVVAKVEAVEPVHAAPAKRKSSGLRAERERSRREEAEVTRPRDMVPAPAPPVTGKPYRVLSAGQILGPFGLEELRGLLAAGKLGAADLIGVETWLPLATLGGLLHDDVVRQGLAAQRSATRAAAAELVPAVADDAADLVPAVADNGVVAPLVNAVPAAKGSAKKKKAEEDFVPAVADIQEDDVHDIPVSEIEEVEESKPQPAKKPDLPKSEGDSIPVDEEFKF